MFSGRPEIDFLMIVIMFQKNVANPYFKAAILSCIHFRLFLMLCLWDTILSCC